MNQKSLVLFSGGIDSSYCLHMKIEELGRENIFAMGFKYGQRHVKELEYAKKIADIWQIPFEIVDLSFLKTFFRSGLTDISQSLNKSNNFFANFIVPGRNGLFLRIAGIWAQTNGVSEICIGVNKTDAPVFPDCRKDYLLKVEEVLKIDLGMGDLKISTPIYNFEKDEILQNLKDENLLSFFLEHTLTCYNGIPGKGCQNCPSCEIKHNSLKKIGFIHP